MCGYVTVKLSELLCGNKNQEDQAMKKTIQVEIKEPQYMVDTNVTFAQVRDWFGHTTKDLKMDIIFPEQGKKKSPCIIWICGGAWQQMSRSAPFPFRQTCYAPHSMVQPHIALHNKRLYLFLEV